MTPGLKQILILIVTILLIVPVMTGFSQASQAERTDTPLSATVGTDKAETPTAMIIIGISLILVAGIMRKKLNGNITSNASATGVKPLSGYVRPLLSRLNTIFFL